MKLISTVTINREINEVWAFMNDAVNFPLWQKDYESTVILNGTQAAGGYKATHIYRDDKKEYRIEERVITADPPNRIETELEHPAMRYHTVKFLEQQENHTVIKMLSEVQMKVFSFKILAPFLKKSFQDRQDHELAALKQTLEDSPENSRKSYA